MSLFDRAINAAADAARSSAAHHQRAQRRHAVDEQIRAQQQLIQWSTGRIGRLALNAAATGAPLPPMAVPAADAVRRWEAELTTLLQQLAVLEQHGPATVGPPPPPPPPPLPQPPLPLPPGVGHSPAGSPPPPGAGQRHPGPGGPWPHRSAD